MGRTVDQTVINDVPKTTRVRKVFGRRKILSEGRQVTISLCSDRIEVRKKWARRAKSISLDEIVDMVHGQYRFL